MKRREFLKAACVGMATTAVAKPAVAQLCPRTSSAALDGIAQERAHVYRSYI